jgi:hypothetical protein
MDNADLREFAIPRTTSKGIVAKRKCDPYLPEHANWLKIRNRNYSQWAGREELFERERGSDPDFQLWARSAMACEKECNGVNTGRRAGLVLLQLGVLRLGDTRKRRLPIRWYSHLSEYLFGATTST